MLIKGREMLYAVLEPADNGRTYESSLSVGVKRPSWASGRPEPSQLCPSGLKKEGVRLSASRADPNKKPDILSNTQGVKWELHCLACWQPPRHGRPGSQEPGWVEEASCWRCQPRDNPLGELGVHAIKRPSEVIEGRT